MPLATVVNEQLIQDAFFWLLTFEDFDSNIVLRAVNNLEDVTSRGNVYTAFPFEMQLYPDDGQKIQNITLEFPNVTRDLIPLIRGYNADKPPKVRMELVLSNAPDVVEKTVDFLSIAAAEYDAMSIRITLTSQFIFNRKTCSRTYNAGEFPGMFFTMQ